MPASNAISIGTANVPCSPPGAGSVSDERDQAECGHADADPLAARRPCSRTAGRPGPRPSPRRSTARPGPSTAARAPARPRAGATRRPRSPCRRRTTSNGTGPSRSRSGRRSSTAGAALAPRCLHRNASCVTTAHTSASAIPRLTIRREFLASLTSSPTRRLPRPALQAHRWAVQRIAPARWRFRQRRGDDGAVEEAYRAVVHELKADPEVSEALMMGMPSLKRGSKMFGGYRDGELLVKVGRERVGRADRRRPRTGVRPVGRGAADEGLGARAGARPTTGSRWPTRRAPSSRDRPAARLAGRPGGLARGGHAARRGAGGPELLWHPDVSAATLAERVGDLIDEPAVVGGYDVGSRVAQTLAAPARQGPRARAGTAAARRRRPRAGARGAARVLVPGVPPARARRAARRRQPRRRPRLPAPLLEPLVRPRLRAHRRPPRAADRPLRRARRLHGLDRLVPRRLGHGRA